MLPRELWKELGLRLTPVRLYSTGWNPPLRGGAARFLFTFNTGVHVAANLTLRVRLQTSELAGWQWASVDER